MTTSTRMAPILVLLLVSAACGSNNPADSPSSTDASAGANGSVASTPSDAPGTTDAVAADNSDDIREIDLGPRLTGLEVALGGTAELVDGNTVRMTFDDGSSAGADPIRACAVSKSLLDEGMILIVAYPDGEKTCE